MDREPVKIGKAGDKYWLDRDQYYELKHFCLQYPKWKMITQGLARLETRCEHEAEIFDMLTAKMDLIDELIKKLNPDIAPFIFDGVTCGLTYNYFITNMSMPCGREEYYEEYRRFFWLLSKMR